MPIFATRDPQLNQALTGLAAAMFPDPATEMMAAYRRAGTIKLMQEAEDLRSAAVGRDQLYGMMGDPGFNAADPNSQRRLYQQAVVGGPDMMKQAPQFFTAYTGAVSPGMDPKHLSQMQVSSGVVPYGGTQPGFELGQRTELGKAGIMAGAHVRGAQIAADQRQREFDLSPIKAGDNDTVYLPAELQARFGNKAALYGASVGGLPGSSTDAGLSARGPFAGTGMDQQASNIVWSYQQLRREGKPIPDDMETLYAQAFNHLYGQKTERRVGADGSVVEVPVTVPVPPGLYPPRATGVPGGVEPVIGGVGAPEAAGVPAPTPEAMNVAQAAPGAPAGAVAGVRTLVPGRSPLGRLGAEEMRSGTLQGQYSDAILDLFDMMGYDSKTNALDAKGYRPGMTALATSAIESPGLRNMAVNTMAPLTGGDADMEKQYHYQVFRVAEPLLRLRSGAATPEEEVRRYRNYTPQPYEGEAMTQRKLNDLNKLYQQAQRFAAAKGISLDDLMGRLTKATPTEVNAVTAEFNQMFPDQSAIDDLVGLGR